MPRGFARQKWLGAANVNSLYTSPRLRAIHIIANNIICLKIACMVLHSFYSFTFEPLPLSALKLYIELNSHSEMRMPLNPAKTKSFDWISTPNFSFYFCFLTFIFNFAIYSELIYLHMYPSGMIIGPGTLSCSPS